MTAVQDILAEKGRFVACIQKSASVLEAAREMNARRIGALVAMDGDAIAGIITERDVLMKVVAAQRDPQIVTVADVMSTPVACCKPQTTVAECRGVMTSKRIRHLPVVDNGKLVGIITIGDIMAREVADHQETIEYLQQYIQGPY